MKTIRLQGCKKTAVIGWMAGMLLLAGCTQDKLADAMQGEMLPEGKYPVTFTATGLGMSTTTTRVTTEGSWETGNEVAVQVEKESVKRYKPISAGASNVTLSAAANVTPFYWQNTSESKSVSAWYLGTGYNADLPTTWSVPEDQNTPSNRVTGYQRSDFLYAPQTTMSFNDRNKELTFYHQTAKVVVNIRNYGVATDANKISSVSINNAIMEGTFDVSSNKNYRLSAKAGSQCKNITPNKCATPNTGVIFDSGKSGENALASYQALVIPQKLGTQSIKIKIDEYNTFTYTIPAESWEGGTQYTYNLTIDGKEVKATVTSSIGWTNDDAGKGSVTLPDVTYDLSTATSSITISDNKTYLITGSGVNNVTISGGSPTVILDGVTLNTSASPCINITGGSPKLNFQGTNTLTGTDYPTGIRLSNNATVTINGNGAQNTSLNIYSDYGIGAQWGDRCGNITINDISLNIKGPYGIGAFGYESTCGNINLSCCSLDIYINDRVGGAACIGVSSGMGNRGGCGNIELRNCKIIRLRPGWTSYASPAAIGCDASWATCGNINIYLRDEEKVDDFLKNIYVEDGADKVGKGTGYEERASVGTVTWYAHDGTKVDEGTKK